MPSVITNISLQKQLFPMDASMLDEEGYLSDSAIEQIHLIGKTLKSKEERLSKLTAISEHTWNSWLSKRRRPADAGLAFLKILVTQPEFVLNTLNTLKAENNIDVPELV